MLGSTYGMWEARDQICFWVVVEPWDMHATSCQLRLWESLCMPLDGGLLFHIKKKNNTTIWSRDWNMTLPDAGMVLLVYQPFNYSQDEFTVQLQL